MRKLSAIISVLLICLFSNTVLCQQSLNLDFEKVSKKNQPAYWWAIGDGYNATTDTVIFFKGKRSAKLFSTAKNLSKKDFGRITIELPSDLFSGKSTMIFSGWIKTNNVSGSAKIGCWQFDKNMKILETVETDKDSITATGEWKKVSIHVTIIEKAKYMYIDATISGTGIVWFDNFEILIDGIKVDY